MKYSIVIPVYNVKNYLKECIESVLSQTFSDYEVILIDDGSWDGSEKICDIYAENDGRIRVIHQKNGGVSVARNQGIAIAEGEFLIFLDSDDVWSNQRFLEKISSYSNGTDLIVFDYKAVPDGGNYNDYKPCGSVKKLRQNYQTGKEFLEDVLTRHPDYLWYPYKYVIRRSVWKENQIFFPEKRIYEDCSIIYQYILKAKRTVVLDECFYHYRAERAGSLTSDDNFEVLQDRLLATILPIRYVLQQKELSEKLQKVLCGNFVAGYYEVLIRTERLSEKEKNRIFELLEENRQICKYAIVLKQKLVNVLIAVLGLHITAGILGIRRKIRDRK